MKTSIPIPRKITPLSIKLEADQKDLLTQIAKEKDRSVHYLLLQAVKEYIEREQARMSFYEDGRKAVEHFNQTGLHVTQDEMRAWADSLGSHQELPSPVCHG